MKFFKSTTFWNHLIALFIAIVILHLPSLHYGFVLDDHLGVEQNQNIRSFDTVFSSPISVSRTLLLTTSYSLGQLDPAYYRIMNIAFHLGTVMGIYILVALMSGAGVAAFFSALIYAVHPILI